RSLEVCSTLSAPRCLRGGHDLPTLLALRRSDRRCLLAGLDLPTLLALRRSASVDASRSSMCLTFRRFSLFGGLPLDASRSSSLLQSSSFCWSTFLALSAKS